MASAQTVPVESRNTTSCRISIRDTFFIVAILGAVKLILHLYVNGRYGYFRDELWYLACSEHLDWGYVDQPPLIAVTVRLGRVVFGDSLLGLRMFAALSMVTLIVLTGFLVREMGGKKIAVWIVGICLLTGPIWMSFGYLMTMNSYEHVIWTACAYCVVRFINTRNWKYWLWFGFWAGVGMETKYSMSTLGLGVVLGLLFTRERKVFLQKGIWLGSAVALLIFLPNLLWNIHYHWPFLELIGNIRAEGRDVVLGPVAFIWQQIVIISPHNFPIWLAGLFWLLFGSGKRYRVLGLAYLVVLVAMMLTHGKNYYVAPAYPMLLAAGGVWLGNWAERHSVAWAWGYAAAALIIGALLAPLSIPLLSPENFLKYQATSPIKPPVTEHSHMRAALPQIFADQFGWQEIVDATAQAWRTIPEADRKNCAIFAQDYGSAGAIDFFGPKYGLPKVISGDRSYWLWGPRGYTGDCTIVLDDNRERLEGLFERVDLVTTSAPNPYALEQQLPVFVAHGAKFGSFEKVWPHVKHWH